MDKPIVLLPGLYVEGWGGGALDEVDVYPRSTWKDFTADQQVDTMAACYLVPGDKVQPRLNLGALPILRAAGQEPEVHWALVDLDRPGHTSNRWPSLAEAAAALYTLLPHLPPGAGGYTTRGGLRVVVPLDPPLPASLANSWLRALTTHLAPAAAALGLEADPSSAEWTRLMRAPRARRDGVVLESVVHDPVATTDPYDLAEQHGWVLECGSAGGVVAEYADMPTGPVDLDWSDWAAAWAHPWLKVGRPIPEEDGHTYPVIQRILASIANAGHVTDPERLISYVWESVENTPGRTVADVWRLACWVAAQEAATDVEEEGPSHGPPLDIEPPSVEEWAAVRPYFRGRDRRLFERLQDGVRIHSQDVKLPETVYHAARLLATRAKVSTRRGIYAFLHASLEAQAPKGPTPDEVWERLADMLREADVGDDNERARVVFTAEYPLTVKQLGKGGALFQLDTRTSPYRYRPTDSQAVYLHFQQCTRPGLPFEAEYPTTMPLSQLLLLYGRTVERVVYTSGQDGTILDSAAGYISQGVHTLEATTSKYHEDVHQYLLALGGASADSLLDWLACITYTASEPLAALYLDGPPSSGKSLLLKICASLWGSAWADYNQAQGSFNGVLLQNPMLVADEGIAEDRWSEDQASEQFRRYVANMEHGINAKFKEPAELHAAIRVAITANGFDGIPFKKALGKDGIDAIVQRVLYIKVGPGARAYLDGLGGRSGIRDWIRPNGQPGRGAEHLLWLRDNRQVKAGKRFLVEGHATDWHRQFVASQGYKPSILAVIAGIAKALQSTQGASVFVRPEPEAGVVWVHHSTVFDLWAKYADVRRPKPSVVSETVDMLAAGEKAQRSFSGTRKWCTPIPFEAFVDAKVLDWGDLGFAPQD